MNILFTLCGRAGSKGFQNKNLKNLLGKPLAYYSVAAIAGYKNSEAGQIHQIRAVLNTDSGELIRLIRQQAMAEFDVIEREPALGGDSVPKVAVIKNCLEKMEQRYELAFDMVVDLDITSPLRTVEDVARAIERKASRTDTDVVFSVTGARRNPYFNMVKEENGYLSRAIPSQYTARQQAPVFYDMNASIYAYSARALKTKEAENFFNDKCDAVKMKDTGVLDIDSEEDFELMQVIAAYLFEKDMGMREIAEMVKRNG